MLLTALIVLTTLLPRAGTGLDALAQSFDGTAAAERPAPAYEAQDRAVSNWRPEAESALRPYSLALTARLSASDPAFVARCVKLNNYWCIKRARWTGEIGGDAEGHTAFRSAADGADAAATLLRRYYQAYGRRSALAIVRRWAPAECGPAPVVAARTAPAAPSPAVTPGLTTRGLGTTLRARYLARHLRGGAPRRAATLRSRPALRVQPWSPLARMAGRPGTRPIARPHAVAAKPMPAIATGIVDTRPAPRATAVGAPVRGADNPAALLERRTPSPEQLVAESSTLPLLAPGFSLTNLKAPAPICAGDNLRIDNYAARIARSVGLTPTDDLKLFSPEGAPLPNLAAVMLAMSAVELGTMRAAPDLVAAAISRLAQEPRPTAEAVP